MPKSASRVSSDLRTTFTSILLAVWPLEYLFSLYLDCLRHGHPDVNPQHDTRLDAPLADPPIHRQSELRPIYRSIASSPSSSSLSSPVYPFSAFRTAPVSSPRRPAPAERLAVPRAQRSHYDPRFRQVTVGKWHGVYGQGSGSIELDWGGMSLGRLVS